MSVSSLDKNGLFSITVRDVGEATNALCSLNVGDLVGIRGPFGNGFTLKGERPLIIGGGTGIAALYPLLEKFISVGIIPTAINGSKTIGASLFRDRLTDLLGERLILATDDGSHGYHGYASELAVEVLGKGDFDQIYACGPELMLVSIFNISVERSIPLQVSLERYIKCASGLCGSCLVGPFRVCKDGPVFDTLMLSKMEADFGRKRMGPSGRNIRVTH
jgi:dihydroorotate dehydrogenase electron transfer subunit